MAQNKGFNALMIQQYIEGKLDPKQMYELEKQALNDPFLADAIEGYTYAKKPVQHHLSILQRQLEERIALQQENKNNFNFTWQRLSVAAAAGLMFTTIGILFWMNGRGRHEFAASGKKADIELSSQPDSISKAILSDKTIAYQNKGKIVAPPLVSGTISEKAIISPAIPHSKSILNATVLRISEKSKIADSTVASGTVLAAGGQRLAGAFVKLRGTNIATITNNDGKFTLPNIDKGILDVKSLGFEPKEIPVNPGDNNLAVILKPDETSLSEVIITAYGSTQSKKTLTSSAANISHIQPADGWQKFQEYLAKNMQYPKMETMVSGDVVVGFTVGLKGRPENIRIIKSLNALCDAEAIRLLNAGPDWKLLDVSNRSETQVTINFRP